MIKSTFLSLYKNITGVCNQLKLDQNENVWHALPTKQKA